MIRAAAVVALGLLIARAAAADPLPKKDRARAAKSTDHRPPPAVGARPPTVLNLYNAWTHEWLALAPGETPPRAVYVRFLRDHYTNEPGDMEPRLLDILRAAATHFKRDRVIVISAFRHPKYNLLLRKKGHQVARNSQHTHGHAVDFELPGIPVRRLHAWARAQKIGGVGLYRRSGFVHMDVGRVRHWEGE